MAIREYQHLPELAAEMKDVRMKTEDALEDLMRLAAAEEKAEPSFIAELFEVSNEDQILDARCCYLKYNDLVYEKCKPLYLQEAAFAPLREELLRVHDRNEYTFDVPELRQIAESVVAQEAN